MAPFNMQVLQLPAKQLLALTFNQRGFQLYLSKMSFINQNDKSSLAVFNK